MTITDHKHRVHKQLVGTASPSNGPHSDNKEMNLINEVRQLDIAYRRTMGEFVGYF